MRCVRACMRAFVRAHACTVDICSHLLMPLTAVVAFLRVSIPSAKKHFKNAMG